MFQDCLNLQISETVEERLLRVQLSQREINLSMSTLWETEVARDLNEPEAQF